MGDAGLRVNDAREGMLSGHPSGVRSKAHNTPAGGHSRSRSRRSIYIQLGGVSGIATNFANQRIEVFGFILNSVQDKIEKLAGFLVEIGMIGNV
jgi:hypothetical protein